MMSLTFKLHAELYALVTLPPDSPYPAWIRGRFSSATRTERELSVIAEQGAAPPGVTTQDGFRCLEIDGDFALDTVGVVAAATAPLVSTGVSVFVISVWSTDFMLIADTNLERAVAALRGAGHFVC